MHDPRTRLLAFVLFIFAALAAPAAGRSTTPASAFLSPGAPASGAAAPGEQTAPDAAGDAEEPDVLQNAQERIKTEVQGLFADPVGTLKRWALEGGPRILGRALLFVVLLALSRILARFAGRLVRRALDRSAKNASALLRNFVENTVSNVVFFIGVVLALQNIGLDIAPLLAGIGVLGFVVGFALQDTLGNFAAGIMLLLYRPFDVGDYVEIAGKEGSVEAMTLVSTTLATLDNQRLTVPNGKIWGDVIRNVTAKPTRRILETVGIGYGDDVDRAMALALEVVQGLDAVQEAPEPEVLLTGLGDSSVNLSIRAWVATKDYFATTCELRRRIKLRFDQEGINIPYPQRDVHLHGLEAALAARGQGQ